MSDNKMGGPAFPGGHDGIGAVLTYTYTSAGIRGQIVGMKQHPAAGYERSDQE